MTSYCPHCGLKITAPTVEALYRLEYLHLRAAHPEVLEAKDGA